MVLPSVANIGMPFLQTTVKLFIELLYLLRGSGISTLHVVLVGKNIKSAQTKTTATLPRDGALPGLSVQFVAENYDDFAAQQEKKQPAGQDEAPALPSPTFPPACVFAVNAGMWGFDEWKPAVQRIFEVQLRVAAAP